MTTPAILDDKFQKQLGETLAIIEELRVDLGAEGIHCPGVVVVGAQSVGKSSVLERLTKIRFPRGENLCTCVPSIVQLQTVSSLQHPHGLVSRSADFEDAVVCEGVADIEEAISRLMREAVKEGEGVRDAPIHIRYTRSAGPVMTLIDLPGIAQIDPQNPDFDIHSATTEMVRQYVNQENMIVLVVIPANEDFSNSEALRIARTYDMEGNRTIGVISKCDQIQENSDIVQKIRMSRDSDVKLALGFIAIRNRGPGEDELDIDEAERQLFQNHRPLNLLREDEWGYGSLTDRIVALQEEHVQKFVPQARRLVQSKISEISKDLDAMKRVPTTTQERRSDLADELQAIDTEIAQLNRAELVEDEIEKVLNGEPSPVHISARWYELALEFGSDIGLNERTNVVLADRVREDLRKLAEEAKGHSLPNSIGDQPTSVSIARFITKTLEAGSHELIAKTAELMIGAYGYVLRSRGPLRYFPNLAVALGAESVRCVEAAQERAREAVGAVVEAEKAQLFTQNARFMELVCETKAAALGVLSAGDNASSDGNGSAAGREFVERYADALLADADGRGGAEQALLDRQLGLHCYMTIMKQRLADVVPMLVRSVIVCGVQRTFRAKVTAALRDEDLEYYFSEDAAAQRARRGLRAKLEGMRQAQLRLLTLVGRGATGS